MTATASIFSANGLRALSQFLDARCLVVFDFDGTLAPIVAKPSQAKISPTIEQLLKKITKLCRVLILTGRSIADVREKLPIEISDIIGNHGFEGCPNVTPEILTAAQKTSDTWTAWLRTRFANDPMFSVEAKSYSVAVHFRAAEMQRDARDMVHREAEKMQPKPHILDGKSVVNILPPGLPDKYQALVEFMTTHQYERALFIGDDVTDNQIFRAQDPRIFSIKVGRHKKLRAPWHIEEQTEIEDFLRQILMIRLFQCESDK
jgi:trehalose 6-phosphate phosphatase